MCKAGIFKVQFPWNLLLLACLFVSSATYGQLTIAGLSANGRLLSMGNSTICSNAAINYKVWVDTSLFPQKYSSVYFYAIFSNKNGSFGASDIYKRQLSGMDNDDFISILNGGFFTISGISLVYDTLLNYPGDRYRVKFQVATKYDSSVFTSADNGFDMSIHQSPPLPQVANRVLEEDQTLELSPSSQLPSGNIIHWYSSMPEGTVTSFSNDKTLTLTGVSFPRTFYLTQETTQGCVSEFNNVRIFPTADSYCDEYMYRVADLSPKIYVSRANYFLDELTGFVSNVGAIMKTVDGGNSWKTIKLDTYYNIMDIQFIGSTTGYVVGLGGGISKTIDGGESWNLISFPDYPFMVDVHFVDEQYGFVGGLEGLIYLTTNGGISWSVVFSSYPEFKAAILDIQFIDDQTGFAIASGNYFFKSEGRSFILKTTNKGLTWTVLSTLTGSFSLTSLCPIGNDIIYVSGGGDENLVENGKVFKSIDGGISWDLVLDTQRDFNFIHDMIMQDEWKGYAATAHGNVLKTNDGWLSYYQINKIDQGYLNTYYLPIQESYNRLSKTSDSTLITCSFSGQVNKIVIPSLPKPTVSGNFSELKSSAEYGNQWYLDNQSLPGANGKSYVPISGGSYSVRQRNSCKESQASNAITITDLAKSSPVNSMFFYPNPATSTITLSQNIGNVNVYSSLGIKLQSYPEGISEINVEGLREGIYILETTNPLRRENFVVVR